VPFEPPAQNIGIQQEEPKEQKSPSEWQVQGRRRHIYGAAANPPSSVLTDSYNGKRQEGGGWIMKFSEFWKSGETGERTYGKVIPPLERYRRYTNQVQRTHESLKGTDPFDPSFLDYMKKELGEHFAEWSKYDWSKIDLRNPFPENPPLRSS
jgi:hypothetical protein